MWNFDSAHTRIALRQCKDPLHHFIEQMELLL